MLGEQRRFDGACREAAFLLGGIGTGNVSVGARGELRDWEIFNRPAKGGKLAYTFFTLRYKEKGAMPRALVLESRLGPPYGRDAGLPADEVGGLPRFESSVMSAAFPFVSVDLSDSRLPVSAKLEAFTPFIPLNTEDSSLPGAVLRYTVTNIGRRPMEVTVAGSLANAAALEGYDAAGYAVFNNNTATDFFEYGTYRGLLMTPNPVKNPQASNSRRQRLYGNMTLITTGLPATYKEEWLKGGWFDGIQDFWDDLMADGRLEAESACKAYGNRWVEPKLKIGSLGVYAELEPQEARTFEFILAWYFPNRLKGWDEGGPVDVAAYEGDIIQNHYATRFTCSRHVADYLLSNLERLENHSLMFQRSFWNSSLPEYVLEALANSLIVIRSTTCFRINDGSFLGWEGVLDTKGSCFGNCTHVWNYAQALAFLFPELEQSMRLIELDQETSTDGRMAFRARQLFGEDRWDLIPAVDGQLGSIVRLYREWKLSGDSTLLTDRWEIIKRIVDFALTFWDRDADSVLEAKHHNTYDIEFFGATSLANTMLLAALKALSTMAEALGDMNAAAHYRRIFGESQARIDSLLYNGEYYIQNIANVDAYKYQYGHGCLSDQLFGQLLAHVAGLGYILPQDHVRQAIRAVYTHNFIRDLGGFPNVQRTFALNDEGGLVLCTWPHGGRPRLPFVYCNEVWPGVEYQVAAHLIYENWVQEGLEVVETVRQRFDGLARNPWDEYEFGHHYVRSMSAWALLLALSGFRYDMCTGDIDFAPQINHGDFSSFWSTGTAWGTFHQSTDPLTGETSRHIEILAGDPDSIQWPPGSPPSTG